MNRDGKDSDVRFPAVLTALGLTAGLLTGHATLHAAPADGHTLPATLFVSRSLDGTPQISPAGVRTTSTQVRTSAAISAVTLRTNGTTFGYGASFRLTGDVTPAVAGVTITRQRLLNGAWTDLGSTTTNAEGRWSMRVTAPELTQTIVYRVVASSGERTTVSDRVTVRIVTPAAASRARATANAVRAVTLAASAQQVVGPTEFTLSGRVTPARAGITVTRQRLSGGRWIDLGSTVTNARGRWTMAITPPNQTQNITYRVVATAAATPVVSSERLTVAVRRAAAVTPTPSPTPSATLSPTASPSPSETATVSDTSTVTASPTPTPSPTDDGMPRVGPGRRILGTDISRWQHPNGAPIDFQKMFRAGSRFVFIKASDGDAVEGTGVGHGNASVWYAADRRDAQAAGMLTGFYHFAQLPNTNSVNVITRSAQLQADLAVSRLARVGGYNAMDLPYVLDIEVAPPGINRAGITLFSRLWIERVQSKTGVRPIVYASPSYLEGKTNRDAFWRQSPLWIAHYMSDREVARRMPGSKLGGGCWATAWTLTNCELQWTFWQYTSKARGSDYGVTSTFIDLNVFNGSAAQLRALTTGEWVPAEGDFMPENEPTYMVVTPTQLAAGDWQLSVRVYRIVNGVPTLEPVIAGQLQTRLALPPGWTATASPTPSESATPSPTESDGQADAGDVDNPRPSPTATASPTPSPTTSEAPRPRVATIRKTADGQWTITVRDLPAGVSTVTVTFSDAARIHQGTAAAIALNQN